MFPLLLALAAIQPAVATESHAALLAKSAEIDASFDAARAKQSQAAYRALARRARDSGDIALASALTAKAAYALLIQGRNAEARLSLIAVMRDPGSTAATRSFAAQLLAYINRDEGDGVSAKNAAIGGYHMTTHSPVGLSLTSRP